MNRKEKELEKRIAYIEYFANLNEEEQLKEEKKNLREIDIISTVLIGLMIFVILYFVVNVKQ